jgi:hypothetical protein
MEMNRKTFTIALAILLSVGTGTAMACEYKKGETLYADYATCRYGEEAIQVVSLPESSSWEQCVYLAEAFRPEKLLAVTKSKGGKEEVSINDRAKIGNPCYLTKQSCDAALKASQG